MSAESQLDGLTGTAADILVLDTVSKSFGQFKAVHEVSFSVKHGEVFGFLGPNGAGKSTTIRMILDILRPTSGSIRLFGQDGRRAAETHRRLGFLSGDMVMDLNLTGEQYLTFTAAQYGKDCRDERRRLADILQANLTVKIGNYSRGNRQKIGLIAALQHQPELLILDEPTSGFDPLVQEKFADLILAFRQGGGTVLMSSHILSEVQELCDRVAFIKDGAIVQVTPVSQLTATAAKRITVKAQPAELVKLRKQLHSLQHVRLQASVESYDLQFAYSGQITPLLEILAAHRLDDLTIKEPDLEEIFMHFYEKDKAAS